MEGVEAAVEFALQGVVHRAVPGQPGQACERLCTDLHRIVCLAPRRCARVTVVEMGLVHYIKLGGGKSSSESSADALAAACQFLRH